ncbi:helix-turn-helix domain-containing protein [Lacrimispora sp. 210928-DFI.3.58]|uniref:helix-turn-helix domain-containing protein n=1 Tax=Lacrimispora sp. 210928-DFI.3.58 TaxID=2883214 RepID=UPI001D068DAE|nr:helix-turn-helix transcriptional regulator [Lacrimispora sp. 210928-DFI.3.58]MCB7317554.1 helix-turn-helix transcriptional regulator [Lacrimispora sp. 210928-DFI.3.58]
MNTRLKELRKTLDLSQESFGRRLGVTKASISRLENGANNFTEQMLKSICREFNVSYLWLTEGSGPMFSEPDIDYAARIDRIMSGENEFAKNIFKMFSQYDDNDWKDLQRLIKKLHFDDGDSLKMPSDLTATNIHPQTAEELEEQFPPEDHFPHAG